MSSSGRGWGRRRIGALALAFLIFAVYALRAGINAGPALNSDLRVAGPWEDWRSGDGIALYYENLYLRDLAHGWLQKAVTRRDAEAAAAARDLLRRSLALAPANAFAWTQLAWAEVALEDAAAARAALDASWRTAPHSADLAISRLALAATLAIEEEAAAQPAILRDIRVARRKAPDFLAAMLTRRPGLRPLADSLDAAPEPET